MYSNWVYYILSFIVVPLVLAGIKAWIGGYIMRLEELENTSISETQVRQLVADKLDPIKEDLNDIKDYLKIINERLLNK